MKRIFFLALVLALCAATGFGQATDDKRPEIFVGYSNLQAEGIPSQEQNQNNSFDDQVFGERTGLHGINVEGTAYLTPRFGLTGDFSYNQRSRSFTGANNAQGEVNTRIFQFMGGPQARFINGTRVTPFVRSLFGVANTRFEVEQTQTIAGGQQTLNFETSSTDFAMALGGGLDVRANNRVSIRVLQVDYNPVFLRDRSINVLGGAGAIAPQQIEGQRQDNIRLGFGVVFK